MPIDSFQVKNLLSSPLISTDLAYEAPLLEWVDFHMEIDEEAEELGEPYTYFHVGLIAFRLSGFTQMEAETACQALRIVGEYSTRIAGTKLFSNKEIDHLANAWAIACDLAPAGCDILQRASLVPHQHEYITPDEREALFG